MCTYVFVNYEHKQTRNEEELMPIWLTCAHLRRWMDDKPTAIGIIQRQEDGSR